MRSASENKLLYIEKTGHTYQMKQQETAEVCRLFSEVLGIAPDHIYIRYSDIPDWGVAGINIDRNRL